MRSVGEVRPGEDFTGRVRPGEGWYSVGVCRQDFTGRVTSGTTR